MLNILRSTFCVLALSLAACGGGGGSGSGSVPTTPVATATASAAPQAQSTSAPLSTSGMTMMTFGTISSGGYNVVANAQFGLQPVNVPQTTASVTMAAAAPNGVAAPSASTRTKSRESIGANTPLVYFTVTMSNTVTLTQTPMLILSFAGSFTQPCYLVAYDPTNPSAGWNALAGPFDISNGTLTIPSQNFSPPFWMEANQPYIFAVVESANTIATPTPSATATPTVAPTSTPSVAPSGAPTTAPTSSPNPSPTGSAPPLVLEVSATSIDLNSVGATTPLIASEGAYSGSFSAASDNTGVVTVAPATNTDGNFTLTAVAYGTAHVTVTDNHGGSIPVTVTVTTTEVTVH